MVGDYTLIICYNCGTALMMIQDLASSWHWSFLTLTCGVCGARGYCFW